MANAITIIRIICSLAMLAFRPLSISFYSLYLIAGFTDMIDGTVARRTGTESELGSRLDTIADFILLAVCLVKILPVLDMEVWIWICCGVIAAIKIINMISGFVMQRQFVTVHSAANRLTGLLLFLLPLGLTVIDFRYSAAIVCAVAAFAAIQEGHIIRTKEKKEGQDEIIDY